MKIINKKIYIIVSIVVFSFFCLISFFNFNNIIVTMKGENITIKDFYNQIKKDPICKDVLKNMIICKVLEKKYGNKITNQKIQKKYNKILKNAKLQGINFKKYLLQNGQTEKDYKLLIKNFLAYKYAIKNNIKINKKDLKNAFKEFHPEIKAQILTIDSKNEAENIKKQLLQNEDFSKIIKKKSIHYTKKNNGKIIFDSTTKKIPKNVKDIAFSLKNNEISNPIYSIDNNNFKNVYYIIKILKENKKKNNINLYKKQLKKIIINEKFKDKNLISQIINKDLKEMNIKIKEPIFKNIFNNNLFV